MAPTSTSTLEPTITDDLSVAPFDGRLAANSRYEEEIDLLNRRDGQITAGTQCDCSVWPFFADDDVIA